MSATAAAIAAGGAIIGGVQQSQASQGASTDQRHFSREMLKVQTKLADSAHQRQVKDLRKAGLNPILSAKQLGSSTPTAMGYQQPTFQNIGAAAAGAGTQAYTADSNARLAAAQTGNTQAQEQVNLQMIQNHKASVNLTNQQIRNLAEEFDNITARADQIAAQTAQAEASANNLTEQARAKAYENVYNKIIASFFQGNEWAAILDRTGIGSPTGAKAALNIGKDMFKDAKSAWKNWKNRNNPDSGPRARDGQPLTREQQRIQSNRHRTPRR